MVFELAQLGFQTTIGHIGYFPIFIKDPHCTPAAAGTVAYRLNNFIQHLMHVSVPVGNLEKLIGGLQFLLDQFTMGDIFLENNYELNLAMAVPYRKG